MEEHEMHAEWIDVSTRFLNKLAGNLSNEIICVGTTSVRTIESIYWMGLKTLINPSITMEDLALHQWDVYEEEYKNAEASPQSCINALLDYLKHKNLDRLFIQTQIIIAPGYQFKIVKGIVTNFHQPKSTLLLLVSALIGQNWKLVYEYSLTHHFRFLSYGDGGLIRLPGSR